ncbi:hypothetical protein FAM09_24640 [Niastella caeni]|uniref:Uncharacterized protein n=1 Tax=Niastella caeni TaxID=2569763 RepID=A0A4S8HGD2_9BACT|nr:hypothetical protein [Niastella caeni]THU34210.1 hypothetical protein FAM09_24640 [Niastella caeni]
MITSDKKLSYYHDEVPDSHKDEFKCLSGMDVISLSVQPKFQKGVKHVVPSCEYYQVKGSHSNIYPVKNSVHAIARQMRRAARKSSFAIGFPSYKYPPLENEDIQIIYSQEKESDIEKALSQAKKMLTLSEGWDEANAKRIEPSTFQAAATFLLRYVNRLEETNIYIQTPEIDPCPDGSIDLNWHTDNARMLVNIRQENNEYVAYYYGDFYDGKMPFKGNIAVDTFFDFFAAWMKYLV